MSRANWSGAVALAVAAFGTSGCEVGFSALGRCDSDADCSTGRTCRGGTCVACPTCVTGERCGGGGCVPLECPEVACAAGGVCLDSQCTPTLCLGVSCPADALCAAGSCYPVVCGGEHHCGPGAACVDGACKDVRCVGIGCPDGRFCAAGKCEACRSRELDCLDGRDEDCDGLLDCADPDCLDQVCGQGTACGRETCEASGRCAASPRLAQTVCRPSAGGCDEPEVCDGAGLSCPADRLQGAGTECRAAGGPCDVAETCDGASAECPVDAFLAGGTVCRSRAGVCDVEERCGGQAPECPADSVPSCAPALLTFDDAPTYDFVPVVAGLSASATLTITNMGAWPAVLAEVSGAALGLSGPFTLSGATCATGATLDPGLSCTLSVAFAPGSVGAASARMGQTYFDGVADQVAVVDLAGQGLAPASLEFSGGPVYDFGPHPTGSTTAQTFSVSNSGGVDAVLGDLSSAGLGLAIPFALAAGGTCATGGRVAPGALCTLAVEFTPLAPGASADSVEIAYHDGVAQQTASLALAGTGDSTGPDTSPPVLTSTQINGGASYAVTPALQVRVAITDASPSLEVRVSEANPVSGDCQSQYADDRWQAYAPGADYAVTVAPVDGSKKVCAWARDAAGNTSVIAPSAGTPGVDSDSIVYQAGNIPVVTSFSVSNAAAGANFGTTAYQPGDPVAIAWTATDVEGLANDPISIYATSDGVSWTPVVLRHGSLAGNPTSTSGSYNGFMAPSAGFFRLKLVAWDQAGNSSIAAVSDSQNTPDWSVYAGSRDTGIGFSAKSVAIMQLGDSALQFDVDPNTSAVYAAHGDIGIVRMDPVTGLVSLAFRQDASTNLPDDGPLPPDPTYQGIPSLKFDTDGLLYLQVGNNDGSRASKTLYQIDLANRWSRRYLGPGTVNDGTADPDTVFFASGPFDIDESHSVYFLSSCTPGVWDAGARTVRILKATQAPDKRAGAVSVVAGNCVRGTPASPGPTPALSSPLTRSDYPHTSSLLVWNDGASLLFGSRGEGVWKILGGQVWASDVAFESATFSRDPYSGRIFRAQGPIDEVILNLAGANGDTVIPFVSESGTGSTCLDDGVDAAQACSAAHFDVRPMGRGAAQIFMDDAAVNSERYHRLRFKDSQNLMRTLLGTLPFHKAGLPRQLVRSRFAGIHYKPANPPNNLAAFPSGLYFLDHAAPAFGYIDPATDRVSLLWGNQREEWVSQPAGSAISPSLSMGTASFADASSLAFDSTGLPWLRYAGRLVSLDGSRRIVQRQAAYDVGARWEDAATGSSAASYTSHPGGLATNIALKDQGAFFIGGYLYASPGTRLSLQLHDYSSDLVTFILGNVNNTFTEDPAQAGRLGTRVSLDYRCDVFESGCYSVYRADEDRIYFSEMDGADAGRIRYVTTPSTPATSLLRTLYTGPVGSPIGNFVFDPANTQIFYIMDGRLRCHDLASGKTWCNDTPLGPPAGLTALAPGPSSLTWRDATHLLISNYRGEIYEYSLPP